jgi:universal stress protein A
VYKHILVTLDATSADRTILEHVVQLATLCGSRVTLLHVADGWAARTYGADAVSREITEDRAYLAEVKAELESQGIPVEAELAYGEPAAEIIKWVEQRDCDLVAMSTHGHRFLGDLLLGTTVHTVRHRVEVPVLLLKARS